MLAPAADHFHPDSFRRVNPDDWRVARLRDEQKLSSNKVVLPEPHGALQRFFRNLGPGLITGAADDDPSGISTYSVAGAAYGYAGLWTALFSFPLMAAVQLMCARLAW